MQGNSKVATGIVAVIIVAMLGVGGFFLLKDDSSQDTNSSSSSSQTEDQASEQAPSQNIVEIASGDAQFSTLVAAVKAASLAETLSGTGPFTVFAPTNAAFEKLPAGTVDTLLKPENVDQLKAILTYHVVPAAALSTSLSDGQKLQTVQGNELTVNIKDGVVTLTDAKGGVSTVTKADIKASNGIIHVIDSVVMPQ